MKLKTSRLTVSDRSGAYKFKPPKGEPTAGPAPLLVGENILIDPEFNLFPSMSGSLFSHDRFPALGTGTYTLPYLDVNCVSFMRYPSGCATKTLASWTMSTGPYTVNDLREDQAWKVGTFPTTSAASTVSYAAYWAKWDRGGGGFPGELCYLSPFMGAPFSARVEPGMSITWKGAAQTLFTTGTPKIIPYIRFYRQSWEALRVEGSPTSLTSTITTFSTSSTVPTGGYWLRCSFGFSGGVGNVGVTLVHSAGLRVLR